MGGLGDWVRIAALTLTIRSVHWLGVTVAPGELNVDWILLVLVWRLVGSVHTRAIDPCVALISAGLLDCSRVRLDMVQR